MTTLLPSADARHRATTIAAAILRGVHEYVRANGAVPQSLSEFAGLALVAHRFARDAGEPPQAVRDLVRDALVVHEDRRSLHGGEAGLLFVLDTIAGERDVLAVPQARLRARIEADVGATLAALDPRRTASFDLIRGSAGKLIALRVLTPALAAAVREAFEQFADTTENLIAARADVEIELGVAHGLAGILGAIDLVMPEQRALAERYVALLATTAVDDGGARAWSYGWTPARPRARRTAWCWGTLGTAAVLADRAQLDGDAAAYAAALRDVRTEVARADHGISDACVCHGSAGLALVLARLSDPVLLTRAQEAAHAVLDAYDEREPTGYRFYDPRSDAYVVRTSVLDGSLGVAMMLLDAAYGTDGDWHRLLALLPLSAEYRESTLRTLT